MKNRIVQSLFFASLIAICSNTALAQPVNRGEQVNVALFVPSGAELLDFAGPGEVFSNADFNTYVIGFTDEPFTSQGFMKIVPNFSYKDCPKPDIIVIPGGGLRALDAPRAAMDSAKAPGSTMSRPRSSLPNRLA